MKENVVACNALRIAKFIRMVSDAGAQALKIVFRGYDIHMEAYISGNMENELPILGCFTSVRECEPEAVVIGKSAIANFSRLASAVLDNHEQKQEEDIQFELEYRGDCENVDPDDLADLDEYLARYCWCAPIQMEFWIERKETPVDYSIEYNDILEVILRFEKFSEDIILWPLPCETYEIK